MMKTTRGTFPHGKTLATSCSKPADPLRSTPAQFQGATGQRPTPRRRSESTFFKTGERSFFQATATRRRALESEPPTPSHLQRPQSLSIIYYLLSKAPRLRKRFLSVRSAGGNIISKIQHLKSKIQIRTGGARSRPKLRRGRFSGGHESRPYEFRF